MYRQFYSLRSMFSRLPMPVNQSNIASWVINLSQRHLTRASGPTTISTATEHWPALGPGLGPLFNLLACLSCSSFQVQPMANSYNG